MKKLSIAFILTGVALLLAALSLVMYNVLEDEKGGEQAKDVLSDLKKDMDEVQSHTVPPMDDFFFDETEPPLEEISIKLDGSEYIGIVKIPDIGIELPVMSEWSYPNLKIAPCRYEGNPATKNMIIAAHNYRSHFGRIGDLSSDSEIIFIDVMGKTYHYEVVNIEQIAGTAIEKMEFGSAEDWDLTLFTCTLNGASRVTVRAVEVQDNEK